jgi:methylated-DNA-[protein]-cysteine S-methyltransferase
MDTGRSTFVFDRIATPIGTLLLLVDPDGYLRALDFQEHESRMHRLLQRQYRDQTFELVVGRAPAAVRDGLEAYFAGEAHALDAISVATGGTPFQREVWAALRNIAPGQTMSYGALAAGIGRPSAVRAVGLANGANPIGLVVPCHRVIGADASLTGYAGGLARKRWLLTHEGACFDHAPVLLASC